MNKAILTIVVTGSNASSVVEALKDADLGDVRVLTEGDIRVSGKDLTKLPNEVWLYEPLTETTCKMFCASGEGDTSGRELTLDEIEALTKFGVCREMTGSYPSSSTHGTPAYAVYAEAAQAEVSSLGFDVAADDFKVDIKAGRLGWRWFRISMPSWFKLAP